MCEIPSNVLLVDEFAELFDGFSIGSNDLTQLTLGVDRDSEHPRAALRRARTRPCCARSSMAIEGAHRAGRKVGICGQAPSDHPEIAELLVRAGIDSLSLSTDVAIATRLRVAELERALAAAEEGTTDDVQVPGVRSPRADGDGGRDPDRQGQPSASARCVARLRRRPAERAAGATLSGAHASAAAARDPRRGRRLRARRCGPSSSRLRSRAPRRGRVTLIHAIDPALFRLLPLDSAFGGRDAPRARLRQARGGSAQDAMRSSSAAGGSARRRASSTRAASR